MIITIWGDRFDTPPVQRHRDLASVHQAFEPVTLAHGLPGPVRGIIDIVDGQDDGTLMNEIGTNPRPAIHCSAAARRKHYPWASSSRLSVNPKHTTIDTDITEHRVSNE
jgi:hypothetical protein